MAHPRAPTQAGAAVWRVLARTNASTSPRNGERRVSAALWRVWLRVALCSRVRQNAGDAGETRDLMFACTLVSGATGCGAIIRGRAPSLRAAPSRWPASAHGASRFARYCCRPVLPIPGGPCTALLGPAAGHSAGVVWSPSWDMPRPGARGDRSQARSLRCRTPPAEIAASSRTMGTANPHGCDVGPSISLR